MGRFVSGWMSIEEGFLCVALSTLGKRVHGITLPPPTPRLRFLVLVQEPRLPAGDPFEARDDVETLWLNTVGLSHSRNAAVAHGESPFLVFADDDMRLDTGGLMQLADHLAARPDLDFVAGWREGRLPDSGARAGRHRLSLRNSGRICAPELMIRRSAVATRGICFDTDFGKGAGHALGEEYVFIADMLRAGLRGEALPVVVGAHAGQSSGEMWHDPAVLNARLAVQRRVFGPFARLVHPLYAFKHRRDFSRQGAALRFALGRAG